MDTYLATEEDEIDLRTLMEEKASTLFKARTDTPQLEVNRLLKSKGKGENEVMRVKQHVEMNSSSDIMALEKVRTC